MHLHRRSYHTPKKLRDIRCIIGALKRHHGFCTRTVPAGGQVLFEKYNTNVTVVGNARRLLITDIKAIYLYIGSCLTKSMNDLACLKLNSSSFLNFTKTIIQIRVRQFFPASV